MIKLKNSHWDDRIKQAKKIGSFTDQDKKLSMDFSTCSLAQRILTMNPNSKRVYGTMLRNMAVGNLNLLNKTAYHLALVFHFAVVNNNIKRATEIHRKLQSRKTIFNRRHLNC